MCTFVETPDIKVLLDAGISLGPSRYGYPPHPKEYQALKERRNLILDFAEKSDVVTISHYHFDHHTPSYTDWASNWSSAEISEKTYKGKIVFAKSYKSKINPSQRHRGWMFERTGGRHASKLEFVDARSFRFGATTITFSKPVFHGFEGSELGWVLMVTIAHEAEKVLFAPDVQGPSCEDTVSVIISEEPQLAIVGGPPLYLPEFRESPEKTIQAMGNLESIVKIVPTTILDHHLLRDENWKEAAGNVVDVAQSMGHALVTAAEYAEGKNSMLESQRKVLFETEPPSPDFIRWTKVPAQQRRLTPPPV